MFPLPLFPSLSRPATVVSVAPALYACSACAGACVGFGTCVGFAGACVACCTGCVALLVGAVLLLPPADAMAAISTMNTTSATRPPQPMAKTLPFPGFFGAGGGGGAYQGCCCHCCCGGICGG